MARLLSYLLNAVYLALCGVLLPWFLFARLRYGKYREGWKEKFLGRLPRREGNRPCVWLHAVSVGEVNLLATLVPELQRRLAGWDFIVTTTTQTGYALAKTRFENSETPCAVCYCPLDFSWAVRNAMRRVRPTLLVLAELELWPNLISIASASGVKVAIVNGRLSERSYRGYRRARPLMAWLLNKLEFIGAQDSTYAERFSNLGAAAETIVVTGSLKYDGAETDRGNSRTRQLAELAGIRSDEIVFLAGSTQEPEESLALEVYRQLREQYPRLRLILVPRHQERFEEVARLLETSGLPWQRRSELNAAGAKPQAANIVLPSPDLQPPAPALLLIDTIGELSAWWGAAHIAFVGGSLGTRGGQNMLEPAAYGAAVSFGPNTRNFREMVATLLAAEAAHVVHGGHDLLAFVRRCLEEPLYARELGKRASAVVAQHVGARERTVCELERIAQRAIGSPQEYNVVADVKHHPTNPPSKLLRKSA